MTGSDPADAMFDTAHPHPARRYDYWLGGKDNFAADRDSGDEIARVFPQVRIAARENRAFLGRAVRALAEAGVDQFLDIGTGIPTAGNTHEVAQRYRPKARVAYVDNDPLVLSHARALLVSDPRGATSYLQADLRRPAELLDHPVVTATLDFGRPVAVLLIAVLHFLTEDDQPYDAVRALLDRCPPGSHLVLSHGSTDLMRPEVVRRLAAAQVGTDFTDRDHDQILRFFDGLDLVEPGLVAVSHWRPGPDTEPADPHDVAAFAGVARKP